MISISSQGPSVGPSRPVSHHENKLFKRGEMPASDRSKGELVNKRADVFILWPPGHPVHHRPREGRRDGGAFQRRWHRVACNARQIRESVRSHRTRCPFDQIIIHARAWEALGNLIQGIITGEVIHSMIVQIMGCSVVALICTNSLVFF